MCDCCLLLFLHGPCKSSAGGTAAWPWKRIESHLDTIYQSFWVHIRPGTAKPSQDVTLRKRDGGLVEAVLPHAPEHRAGLCQDIYYLYTMSTHVRVM